MTSSSFATRVKKPKPRWRWRKHSCRRSSPFEPEPGEIVQAVAQELVREAYYREYPADGDSEKKRAAAKKKAFGRAVKEAQAADLIGISNLGGITRMWIKGAPPRAMCSISTRHRGQSK
jgi:hypothetical protein